MEYTKDFFEKVFSEDRMKKYFLLYPDDEQKAVKHYQCNIMLSEAMYPCLSVFEVELRNSVVLLPLHLETSLNELVNGC